MSSVEQAQKAVEYEERWRNADSGEQRKAWQAANAAAKARKRGHWGV